MNQNEYLLKAHEILLKTLLEFDRVCQKHNIQYYLICGSLLGAVRHKDFIPWDDDVDVAVAREDFEKLKLIAEKEWDGKEFLFVDYDQLGKGVFLDFMTRLVYMGEEIPVNIYQKIRGKGRKDIENHLPIDIYILDNACDDEKRHNRITKIIQGLYGLAMGHRAYVNYAEYENKDKKTQKTIKILSKVGRFIPLKIIFSIYEIIRKSNCKRNGEYYYESNGWIYCIPWRFKKEWFGEGAKVEICGHEVWAPENYDEFLKMHYWDYMQLPPVEKRVPTHAVTATGIFHEG